MGVFHVFEIVQMLPNRATHHTLAGYTGPIALQLFGGLTHFSPVLYFYTP